MRESVIGGTAVFLMWLPIGLPSLDAAEPVGLRIERSVVQQGFDGASCWVHARAGTLPGKPPVVVMTMQKLLLSGSDVFYALHQLRSGDLGRHWSDPLRLDQFRRRPFGPGDPGSSMLRAGDEVTVCDFTPKWHAASDRLLGTGQTVWYRDNRGMPVRPRSVAYAVYDAKANTWAGWKRLELPERSCFVNAGAGSVQRHDLANGEILLPIYYKKPEERSYSVTVCRCRFDGETLSYLEHGTEHTIPVERGFAEPSLTRFGDRFYLTLRNDQHGYVTSGGDGLHFDNPRRWTFDDGKDLGNYNTQQHWVTHCSGLFLVYTRRSADNDHVFRHRAPLFIARVDPEKLQVIRATEQVLVPEHGARLGNFGVTEVSEDETWVTVTEWMQPVGVEEHGSDNRVYVARIKWRPPENPAPRP